MSGDRTWRALIAAEMAYMGDSWENIEAVALPPQPEPDEWGETEYVSDLDAPFDAGYGKPNGCPFTVWTRSRVYFPATYDGAEFVASVPRHPSGHEVVTHVGG